VQEEQGNVSSSDYLIKFRKGCESENLGSRWSRKVINGHSPTKQSW
jgi:hypothetical protein